MASSISRGIVFTTAMLASTTVLYLAFSWQKIHGNPNSQNSESPTKTLHSCLYSEEKRREKKMKMKKKKKKVQFADNVKTEEAKQRKQKNRVVPSSNCCRHDETSEIPKMPANRIALYNGILRDRLHRMECSY